jgi:hypothetical protein
MEKKMDENRDQMEKKMDKTMEELKNSMSTILLHTLDEILSQRDIRTQGNHVNLREINIEPQNHDYSSCPNTHHQGFHSTPMNYLIPKINMREFDGKDNIAWILYRDKFIDLQQVPILQKVTLASLYL